MLPTVCTAPVQKAPAESAGSLSVRLLQTNVAQDEKFRLDRMPQSLALAGEVQALLLDVNYDGASVRWALDPTTYRILRSSHSSTGPQGEAKIVSEY